MPKPNATCSFGVRLDVEAERVVEHVLVAVGRRVEQQQLLALLELLARGTRRRVVTVRHMFLIGRDPAQHLLDRAGMQRAVGAQQLPLVGVRRAAGPCRR